MLVVPASETTWQTPMWQLVVARRRQLGRRASYRAIAADMADNPQRLPPLSYGSLARVAMGRTGFDPRTLQLLAYAASGFANGEGVDETGAPVPAGTKIETTYEELDAIDREWRSMPTPGGVNRPFYVPPDWVEMPMTDREIVLSVGNQLLRARGIRGDDLEGDEESEAGDPKSDGHEGVAS